MEEDLEEVWADFMAVEGLEIEDEIEHYLVQSRGLLDMVDGTHAQWVNEDLGVLLMFQEPELYHIVNAWDDAQEGNLVALASLMHWLEGFAEFLSRCITTRDDV